MKKLLVVSDSHGQSGLLEQAIREAGPFDILFHLGDGYRDLESVPPPDVPLYRVRGNMDFPVIVTAQQPEPEILLEMDGVRVLAVHGHQYRVHATREELMKRAGLVQAGLVLFGHTHAAEHFTGNGGTVFFNPGALKHGSYGTMTLEAGTVRDIHHHTVRNS